MTCIPQNYYYITKIITHSDDLILSFDFKEQYFTAPWELIYLACSVFSTNYFNSRLVTSYYMTVQIESPSGYYFRFMSNNTILDQGF